MLEAYKKAGIDAVPAPILAYPSTAEGRSQWPDESLVAITPTVLKMGWTSSGQVMLRQSRDPSSRRRLIMDTNNAISARIYPTGGCDSNRWLLWYGKNLDYT